MDTLQQVPPCGSLVLSLAHHPQVTCWVAVAVCDIWLNNFRLQNVSESQGKVDFPAHVCVCVCCVTVCGSNFIIGFPSAIKILRIFKSIYSSDVPCPALGLGESNEKQWHKLPSKLTLELPSGPQTKLT